ncbi:MAG: hypothetical protein ACR2JR_08015, partial [Rubrobacteraceae bacterium]
MTYERYARLAGSLPRLVLAGFVAAMLMLLAASPAWAQATTVIVDDDGQAEAGNCDATTTAADTMQEGIDAAVAGSTVQVCPGTYNEKPVVNKALTVNGAQAGNDARDRSGDESVVQSGDSNNVVFNITANGVTIDGFTVQA